MYIQLLYIYNEFGTIGIDNLYIDKIGLLSGGFYCFLNVNLEVQF